MAKTEWHWWGYYNTALPGDDTVHIACVDMDYDPLRPLCKCSRSTKFEPVSGWVPRRRFCKKCLALAGEALDDQS